MRSRYKMQNPEGTYFVTATIVEWLPVFTTAACCDILVDSLLHCREHKGLKIHAWVILDNHFHAILAAPGLAGTLTDLKRFTARALLTQIKKEKRDWLDQATGSWLLRLIGSRNPTRQVKDAALKLEKLAANKDPLAQRTSDSDPLPWGYDRLYLSRSLSFPSLP